MGLSDGRDFRLPRFPSNEFGLCKVPPRGSVGEDETKPAILDMKKKDSGQSDRSLKEVRQEIAEHDELYYKLSQPKISDQQYDKLKRELESLEAESDPLGLFSTDGDKPKYP